MEISNTIKRFYNRVERKFHRIVNTLIVCLKYKTDEVIFINSWVLYKFGRLKHRNFGDELNVYLVEALTNKVAIPVKATLFKNKINYCVIGSILDWIPLPTSIIWGSGVMFGWDEQKKRNLVFKEVSAVRGKLTYEYLRNKGIQCPQIYGDPALLLPYVYKPEVAKKYKIGIITHISDNNRLIQELVDKNKDAVTRILLNEYNDWHEVINRFLECDLILSSSLHGLIIADAYGIPNVWIRSGKELAGGDFKFLDYFSSVNRTETLPLTVKEYMDVAYFQRCVVDYKKIEINLKPLVDACPFEIRKDIATQFC